MSNSSLSKGKIKNPISKLQKVTDLEQQAKSMRDEALAMGLQFEAYLLNLAVMAFTDRVREFAKPER